MAYDKDVAQEVRDIITLSEDPSFEPRILLYRIRARLDRLLTKVEYPGLSPEEIVQQHIDGLGDRIGLENTRKLRAAELWREGRHKQYHREFSDSVTIATGKIDDSIVIMTAIRDYLVMLKGLFDEFQQTSVEDDTD